MHLPISVVLQPGFPYRVTQGSDGYDVIIGTLLLLLRLFPAGLIDSCPSNALCSNQEINLLLLPLLLLSLLPLLLLCLPPPPATTFFYLALSLKTR